MCDDKNRMLVSSDMSCQKYTARKADTATAGEYN